jgi:hypothetical protein
MIFRFFVIASFAALIVPLRASIPNGWESQPAPRLDLPAPSLGANVGSLAAPAPEGESLPVQLMARSMALTAQSVSGNIADEITEEI